MELVLITGMWSGNVAKGMYESVCRERMDGISV